MKTRFDPFTIEDPLTLVDVRFQSGHIVPMQVWWATLRTAQTGEEIIGVTDESGWF